ncbi:hypothetical protein ABNN70_09095 [Sporolactobacillus sp. Y61]|uniref:Transposase IS204/IS1001/IS1096/IS1165 zinc-finger domain-containing protein n=1 Tax=Sporolactobacillus sp. Y61 TaxID=3160863 RepID=A0AAU8ICE6_9BACL
MLEMFQVKSRDKPRIVIIQSVPPANELFFTHPFVVMLLLPTNLSDCEKCGTMENYIRVTKSGFSPINCKKFRIMVLFMYSKMKGVMSYATTLRYQITSGRSIFYEGKASHC